MSAITDQLGRVFAGRYRIEAGLGTGASAHVYRAVDVRLGRVVALKVLHPGLGDDSAFIRRFRAEAQTVATLSHPNLVRLFDFGWEDGEPYLVLEYLAGGSLRDLLDGGRTLDVAQAAAVGAQAARGLSHAHRRGLLHRDIKPANLLFDEDGIVRIADFGIARALADAAWTEPSGTVLGTARYSSPEQAEGRVLDGRSDVYSLALVLYESVTGDVPFNADTTLGTLRARVGAVLPPARELGALYPILAQAAISDPLARLDASDLAVELELLSTTLGRPAAIAPRDRAAAGAGPQHGVTQHSGARPHLYDGDRDLDRTEMGGAPPAPATFDSVEDDEEPPAPSRRRHRVRRFAVGLVVLAALVTGGVAAVVHFVVYSHVVPGLQNLSTATAQKRVASAGLVMRVSGSRYTTGAPSGAVLTQSPAGGTHLKSGTEVSVVVSKGAAPVTVPDVKSLSSTAATQKLSAVHLTPRVRSVYSETVPTGTVIRQNPAHGTVRYGGPVTVVVSLGPAPRTIPTLSNATWAQASSSLSGLRLTPYETQAFSTSVPSGQVISTTPAEGTTGIAVGTRVDVVVSKGPQLVAVPTVAGQSISEAVASLRGAGLNVTEVVGPPFATQATTTDPAPSTEVAPGTSITLYSA